jgi:type IV pilus assembly protein PilB
MQTSALTWRRLGSLLLDERLIDPDQLALAFEEQERSGKRLGEIVLEKGWIERDDLYSMLARQAGLPYCDLAETPADPEICTLLAEHLVARYRAIPIRRLDDDSLLVGVTDPTDLKVFDDLKLVLDARLTFALVSPDDFERISRAAFRGSAVLDEEFEEVEEEQDDRREEVLESGNDIPAVRLVNAAIGQAIQDGASDIHFVPQEDRVAVLARIDGMAHEVQSIPKQMQVGVISRLKIMGQLDIAERRLPQDGRVLVRLNGEPVDLRIAVLPTTHGERVVLRVLQRSTAGKSLADLGMSPDVQAEFERAIRQPYGTVVVCGPTGSGKTTTLYAGLAMLNEPGHVLMTIEDPVENEVDGISQIEVNPRHGLTFARGLRTILRSDPDCLLVGEVRDEETARIAIQAGMTGHLVLTSLHTNNAASSIARLKDMGVPTSLIAASVNCVVAQRLVRRLCLDCREAYTASPEEQAELGVDGPVTIHRAKGCYRCADTGFRGRAGIYEVMPLRGELRGLVDASTEEILAAAVAQGMRTLREDGNRLCLAGTTSLDEVARVAGDLID